MSRPLRIEFAGALYHVTSRGNERKPIFWEEQDFELFLEVLDEVCLRFNWVIHAWHLKGSRHLIYATGFNPQEPDHEPSFTYRVCRSPLPCDFPW